MRMLIRTLPALVALLTLSSATNINQDAVSALSLTKRVGTDAKCPSGYISLGPSFAHGQIPDKGEFAACCPLAKYSVSVYYQDPQIFFHDWPFWTALGYPLCCTVLDGTGCSDTAVSADDCARGWEIVGTPGWPDTSVCHKIDTPSAVTEKRELVDISTSFAERRRTAPTYDQSICPSGSYISTMPAGTYEDVQRPEFMTCCPKVTDFFQTWHKANIYCCKDTGGYQPDCDPAVSVVGSACPLSHAYTANGVTKICRVDGTQCFDNNGNVCDTNPSGTAKNVGQANARDIIDSAIPSTIHDSLPSPDLSSHHRSNRTSLTPRQDEHTTFGCTSLPGYSRIIMQPDPLFHQAYEVCCEDGFTAGAIWQEGDIRCCSDCNEMDTCTGYPISMTECDPRYWAHTSDGTSVCKMYQPFCAVRCGVNGCTQGREVA